MTIRTRGVQDRRIRSVLVCALLAVTAASCSDDEPDVSDAAGGDPTTATTTAPTETSAAAPALDHVDDATTFWEAVVAGDRATALGFIGPAPVGGEPERTFGKADTMDGQFDWYEAVGWQWTLEGCEPSDAYPEDVQCDVTAKNAWSDALGVDPVTATVVLTFDDDGYITSVGDGAFANQWVGQVFQPFQAWVQANHPDDADVMWGEDGVNAEILDLFDVNTERFVAAQDGT